MVSSSLEYMIEHIIPLGTCAKPDITAHDTTMYVVTHKSLWNRKLSPWPISETK